MVSPNRPSVQVEIDATAASNGAKDAHILVQGVDLLTGTYTAIARQFHSQRVFKKTKENGSSTEASLFLYYWRGGHGHPAGWWIANAIGNNNAYAFCRGSDYPPPKEGWIVPVQGVPALHGLKVTLNNPRFGKFQQNVTSSRVQRLGTTWTKNETQERPTKKVRKDFTKSKSQGEEKQNSKSWYGSKSRYNYTTDKRSGTERHRRWQEGLDRRFKKAMLGRWSGHRSGHKQYHEISEGSKRSLWSKTIVDGANSSWTQISVQGKTAYWGKGKWRIDLEEIEKNPRRLNWRNEHSGITWVWSWEG